VDASAGVGISGELRAAARRGPHGLGTIAFAGAVSAFATGIVMAAEYAQPVMKVGDRWTWRASGGLDPARVWTETVVEVLPGGRYRSRIEGEPQGPRMVEFDGPGNLVQPPPWPTLRPMQFPLVPGKAWAHAVADTEAQSRSIAYRAVGVERRKVAGRELECLRIEGADTTTVSGHSAASPVKLWYCPDARQVVRKETRISVIPVVGLVTLEVTDFRLVP